MDDEEVRKYAIEKLEKLLDKEIKKFTKGYKNWRGFRDVMCIIENKDAPPNIRIEGAKKLGDGLIKGRCFNWLSALMNGEVPEEAKRYLEKGYEEVGIKTVREYGRRKDIYELMSLVEDEDIPLRVRKEGEKELQKIAEKIYNKLRENPSTTSDMPLLLSKAE